MSQTDAEACQFVADHYGRRAAGIRLLGAGEWSRAYRLVLDGRDAVIRFGNHVEDFRKDQVMATHNSAALPIPPVIASKPIAWCLSWGFMRSATPPGSTR